MLFTSQPHSEGEERRPTFLEPAIGGSCAPSEDALHVNPNGTVNAVLSPDNAEAQALGKEEGGQMESTPAVSGSDLFSKALPKP